MVMDVIKENAGRGVVNELMHANDLVLMRKTIEDSKKIFWNWKDALESKGLRSTLKKTTVMVS